MKQIFLSAFLLVFFAGCKSTTEPQNGNKLGSSVTVSSNGSLTLEGGGRWFVGSDTGTWYDMDISYAFQNTSSDKDISYTIEIGEYKNGRFQTPNGDLFYDGDSVMVGAIQLVGNSTQVIHLQSTIGVGRKNRMDWSYPYGVRVTFVDKPANASLVLEDSLSGSNPQNRFHGIIYTTEASPDPLGEFDLPLDSSWHENQSPRMGFLPCYPNPTLTSTSCAFVIADQDSVIITLNKTKKTIMKTFTSGELFAPGQYTIEINIDSLRFGEYRLYGRFVDSQQTFISYGNIWHGMIK